MQMNGSVVIDINSHALSKTIFCMGETFTANIIKNLFNEG